MRLSLLTKSSSLSPIAQMPARCSLPLKSEISNRGIDVIKKKTEIVLVASLKEDVESIDFFTRVFANPELSRDFMLARMGAHSISDVLREWIIEHGISSLFNYHITCDSVLHPGISVDEIEKLILGFLGALRGVKNLLVIDPYFYTSEPAVLALFENMVRELSGSLESVTFFTRTHVPPKDRTKADPSAMHSVLTKVVPSIKIKDVKTDEFHDRFWIDPDRSKGLVMGTSLNGVTKKIALIDHLGSADAAQLARMALALA